jgi:anti-sigma B factor antagonist
MSAVIPDDGTVVVSTSVDSNGVVLALTGDLDVSTARDLVVAAEQLEPFTQPVTVDFDGLSFLDSAGLRALLTVRERAERDTGHRLRLVNVGPEQHRLLEMCGVLGSFDVETKVS